MKKRAFAVFLVVVIGLSLAACGKGQRVSETDLSENENIVTQQEEDRDEAVPEWEFKTTASIEETVLLDENDIKITATGLKYTDDSVALELTIENHTDKDLSFVSGITGSNRNAVNGYMLPDSYGYWHIEVDAGKREDTSYSFDIDELLIYGITEIADIQMGFFVQDEEYDYTIYGPLQIKTSVAESHDYGTNTYQKIMSGGVLEKIGNCTVNYYGEDELYDHNGVRIVSEALITNQYGEKVVLLEIVNDSSEIVYGTVTEISVNGLIVSDSEVTMGVDDSINPGTRRIKAWTLNEILRADFLEVFGISGVGEFSCLFTVNDEDYRESISQEEISFKISEEASLFDADGVEVYNENGIRIISKGLFEAYYEYSNDIEIVLLIENHSSEEIYIDVAGHSVFINGSMRDNMTVGQKVPSEKYAAVDVELDASGLDETGIHDIDDIKEAEIAFQIKDAEGNVIAQPLVSVNYQ